jgi:hypothetical protein
VCEDAEARAQPSIEAAVRLFLLRRKVNVSEEHVSEEHVSEELNSSVHEQVENLEATLASGLVEC